MTGLGAGWISCFGSAGGFGLGDGSAYRSDLSFAVP